MGFLRAFGKGLHKRLLSRLRSCGIREPVLLGVKNWLHCGKQDYIDGSHSGGDVRWVPQGSVLELVRWRGHVCGWFWLLKTKADCGELSEELSTFSDWATIWQLKWEDHLQLWRPHLEKEVH